MNIKAMITAGGVLLGVIYPFEIFAQSDESSRIMRDAAEGREYDPEAFRQAVEDTACNLTASNAESFMSSRQSGVPLNEVLETVSAQRQRQEYTQFQREVVLQAFEIPRFNTPSMQQNAIMDFRNEWDVYCRRNLDEIAIIITGSPIPTQ